jgi:uncharacterized membrane protein
MSIQTIAGYGSENLTIATTTTRRVQSIDLLRGSVMIIMALDHVRDYFHHDAFLSQPTDLTQTNAILFLTRWITHYCAPVFVFLAGISAYLYGNKRSKKELSRYLLTRGLWLVFAELSIITLGWTFNPTFPFFNLQVIWAIGFSMIVLSAMVYMPRRLILLVGLLLIAGHNLLDSVHIPGSFLWSILHDPADFVIGNFSIYVRYPVLPWIGIIAIGYYLGGLYTPGYDPELRQKILFLVGLGAICVFIILRAGNFYGDAAHWDYQQSIGFSFLSFLNVSKYPPSLLYILMTLGPALIFLSAAERPLNAFTEKIAVFGRVPFFYYLLHIYLIHFLAMIATPLFGYNFSDMILTDRVNSVPGLKNYGFELPIVYCVWVILVFLLYPCCKWFDRYKRMNQSAYQWLSYL